MPLIARQRSRLAVLAVLALVGSLLAISAVPAVAAGDKKASNPATYSACVGAAEDDAGFSDTDGLTAEDAINCLAHYDITQGTSEGVYSPRAPITRVQMALFLARAAGPAGIELEDPAEDQDLTDIADLSSEAQDAINQLVELEIMTGSNNQFSPAAMVTRADMAVFLDGFLEVAPIGPGGLGGETKYSKIEPDDDPFTDIGSVSFGAYGAIRRVYELGVAKGTTETTFLPNALVTRAQMALFVTRALAHTNARPAGISAQADPAETDTDGGFALQVSVRDSDHMPVADAVLDVFSGASAEAAFDDDGLCEALADGVNDPAATSTRCEIDAGDEATDSEGNREIDVEADDYCPGSTKWVWAWTADIGDKFDADDTEAASVGVSITKPKKSLKASNDADASVVEFGETVIVTIQVVDKAKGKGDPVSEEDVEITIITEEMSGNNTRNSTQTHKTDASGKVELTFSYDDPDTDTDSDEVTVTVTRSPISGLDTTDADDNAETPEVDDALVQDVAKITWSDNDPVATTLTLSQSVAYHLASDNGGGVRHSVTATLTDQYGDPVSGVPVHFWSDANSGNFTDTNNNDVQDSDEDSITLDDGLGGAKNSVLPGSIAVTNVARDADGDVTGVTYTEVDNFAAMDKTNRKGVASKSYHRDSTEPQTEVIGALAQIGERDGARLVDTNEDGSIDENDDTNMEYDDIRGDADADMDEAQDMNHYWAETIGSAELDNLKVVAVDTDANTVVVQDTDDEAKNLLAEYDSNDQFNASDGGVKMATFEDDLEVDDILVINMANDPEPGVNSLTNGGATVPGSVTCHA